MTLIYRGQTYTPSNHAAAVNRNSTFTYRGQSYQRSTVVPMTYQSQLVYRGVPYHNATEIATAMGFECNQVALFCPLCA